MLKTREILRLKHEVGLSLREIGQSCNCGKSTVSEILERAEKAGISWPIDLSDKQLVSLLHPSVGQKKTPPEPDLETIFYEMKKKSVTLMLLWEEYKAKHPDGIMYTQFCERYRSFKKQNQLTIHIEHKGGEEVQVDWAGQTLSYTDPETGEIKKVNIFVAVLPASAYPFVHAYEDMKLANWLDAHANAYEYFGGVPKVTIPDNTKTAVTTADRVDPVLNKSYSEMARHYRTTLVPARAGKPKDKAADENMVGNVSRRILAALRNHQFFSLAEINQAIAEEVEKFIKRPFQKLEGNRKTAFEQIDKPFLQALPARRYEYADWKEAKIGFNYHVEYEGFFYSVHYSHAGQRCSIRATSHIIEIYRGSERVGACARNYNKFSRYTTLPEHMPEQHKAVFGWNSERFLSWAEKIGSNTKELIRHILQSREYPVQTYRTCMGVMRIAKLYPAHVMESASREALDKKTYSYKYLALIAKQHSVNMPRQNPEVIVKHDNVRGISAYAGGGIRV